MFTWQKLFAISDLMEKVLSKTTQHKSLRIKTTCVDRSLSGSHRHVWCVCNKSCSLHDRLSDTVYLHCQFREVPQDLPKWQNNDTSAVSCFSLTRSCTHVQTMCSPSHKFAYGLILADLAKHIHTYIKLLRTITSMHKTSVFLMQKVQKRQEHIHFTMFIFTNIQNYFDQCQHKRPSDEHSLLC